MINTIETPWDEEGIRRSCKLKKVLQERWMASWEIFSDSDVQTMRVDILKNGRKQWLWFLSKTVKKICMQKIYIQCTVICFGTIPREWRSEKQDDK